MSYKIHGRWLHSKAAEEHVDVTFSYPGREPWRVSFPIKCRRAGIELDSPGEVKAYVEEMYDTLHPDNWERWRRDAEAAWGSSRSDVTKPIFDQMAKHFSWMTYKELPNNSNPARRIQVLKEMGFTVGTRKRSGTKDLEFILLPKPRGQQSGYEYWSGSLRKRIIRVLRGHDAFEGKPGNVDHLLPDHKFPEIRWDRDTRRTTLENLTDQEILRDFQLLTNQRNQQKREVCRRCLETGERGTPFSISYYYKGGKQWPDGVPRTGKDAECGCEGCGWYDLSKWRASLQKRVGLT